MSSLYRPSYLTMPGDNAWLSTLNGRDVEVVWRPNAAPQTVFLQSWAREVLYGGAVGGGKTDALVMGDLRFVAHPHHRSITLRRTIDDLQEILDRQKMIYEMICPQATWVESRRRWEWPSGAFSLLGSAHRIHDIEAYKSFEFNLVNFDELTLFERYQYIYMLSRNRSKSENLPLMMRAGTNPDGPGHSWVFNRFLRDREPYTIYRTSSRLPALDGEEEKVVTLTQQFIPSTVFDNPQLSGRDEYIAGLMSMGKQLAEALLYGKWDYFRGQMFPYGEEAGLVEVKPEVKHSRHYLLRCLDYGWSDHTVVYWLLVYPDMVDDDEPDIEIVEELAVSETNVRDIAGYIKRVETRLVKEGLPLPSHSVIDPSTKAKKVDGRSTLSLFEENGVWFTPANNDRQAGWARVRNLLENGRIGYWKGSAPYLRHTLPKLVRDPRKADDLKPKQNDHGADSLRYGVMEIRDHRPGMAPESTESRRPNQDRHFDRIVSSLQDGGAGDTFPGMEGF